MNNNIFEHLVRYFNHLIFNDWYEMNINQYLKILYVFGVAEDDFWHHVTCEYDDNNNVKCFLLQES